MTEQKLIDTINALIDMDVQAECPALKPKDIARRALDRCGVVFDPEAVTDLAAQIFSARCEPWKWPPGARPRLNGWKDGISRLIPKSSVAQLLEAGRQAGEPIAVTLAGVRRAYPRLTEGAMGAEISAYMAWLRDCAEKQSAFCTRAGAKTQAVSYEIILADPPWSYRDRANAGKRGAVHKYRTLGLPGICALDVLGIAAPNCLLALWWVPPMPAEALQVVSAWGFTLKTMKGLHKTTKHGKSHFGMGHWTRANTEDCLFAVRGKPKRANADVRQFIEAPRGRHSAKPDEVRERLVRLMGDVPRIEMFAREAAPGWDVWGLEVESTIELG